MAEFKLERFKYNWEGDWQPNTNYNRDSIVRYGGKSYVCLGTHTSDAVFYTDLYRILPGSVPEQPEPRWIEMTSGKSFVGTWAPATFYKLGDVVLHTGSLWKCVGHHTSSAFETNQSDWELFSSGLGFQADWQQSTNYGAGALVTYNGNVYKCITAHTSQTILEDNIAAWEIYFEGVQFVGVWTPSTLYRRNNYVKYGGSIFLCINTHTSDGVFNDNNFQLELPGFQFDGEWNNISYYQVGDIVRYGGYLYSAISNNTNNVPTGASEDSTSAWSLMQKSYNFRGNWRADSNQEYYTGDVVRRGGQTLICVKDVIGDGSSLDYEDDDVFWETLIPGSAWKQEWREGEEYAVGDVVNFYGDIYACNRQHFSFPNNYPGDNGSGYEYWDFLAQAGTEAGMRLKGDLLTFDYRNRAKNDLSTLGPAAVPATVPEDLLSIIETDRLAYRTYGEAEEYVVYVDRSGLDRPGRGLGPLKPFRTIRYALEYLEDKVPASQPKKVRISTGNYEEVCPMIVPAYCVVMGDELRSTTITANPPMLGWDNTDLAYTVGGLNRILELLPNLFENMSVEKNPLNSEDPVYDPQVISSSDYVSTVEALVTNIIATIEYNLGVGGFQPDTTGTNELVSAVIQRNAATILNNNREFLIQEFLHFINEEYPQYSYDAEWLRTGVNSFIRAWEYDLQYPGNYQSILAGRRFAYSVLGSQLTDMFYLRDKTGLRNCTVKGLQGSLNPPGVFDIYQRPTGGAFCSLDPGWGPDDDRTWIMNRSPYIQGVTTIGSNCVGQKVDGALHNGGNKSFVSNDFTQVLSDGIGAWILNNARAELVSVFTYYCQVGYLAEDGGVIRATNGNNSYGTYGSIADGIDPTEEEKIVTLNTRENQAVVATAFAGEVTDEIQIFEYSHCGEQYTTATADITGAGNFADVIFDDIREGGMFQARLIPPPDSGSVGGSGFLRATGNCQTGNATSITLSGTDSTENPNKYIGMRIVLVSGDGTGQYGYIQNYNVVTKVATVYKESDSTPGWDHVIAGTAAQTLLTTNTQYSIEPRVLCADPGFDREVREFASTREWQDIAYGTTTQTYENITVGPGTGSTIDVDAANARFTITRRGKEYSAVMLFEGLGYAVGDSLVIPGNVLGGETPANDCTITVDTNTDDSSNSIISFSVTGTAKTGVWVATATGDRIAFSYDGEEWNERLAPADANWSKIQPGDDDFVVMQSGVSGTVIRSINGEEWQTRNLPVSLDWADIAFGDGVFVMVAKNDNRVVYSTNRGVTWRLSAIPDSTVGDSTENQWQSITYGRGQFIAISGTTNTVAVSEDGVNWTLREQVLPAGDYDWAGIAYGRGRYVAISKNNSASAISADGGTTWMLFSAPSLDDSTPQRWREIKYANGVFMAVAEINPVTEGSDGSGRTYYVWTTEDGITWKQRDTELYKTWGTCSYGVKDGTGKWAFIPSGSDFVIVYAKTGAAPRLRANLTAGVFNDVRIWDPGSGFTADNLPEITVFDTQYVLEITTDNRIGDGVLAQPTFLNRGLGYRTSSTIVKINGDGYADIIPAGNTIVLNGLTDYPGPGTQLLFETILDDETEDPNDKKLFVAAIITPLGSDGNGGLKAQIQISPTLKITDNVYHGVNIQRRDRYSQCRISGHDFLDIGTGNFEETNYPQLYSGGAYFTSAPENEVTELNGGRVFYTSTDQDGNFRAGELFSVQQSTGIVTISAEYFDLDGLSELALGGVRLGGSGTVIREFSTDPNFTEDSNNVIPTQRAISTFLANRLSEGGSELETNSIIAGVVQIGTSDNIIGTTTDTFVRVPVMANFDGEEAGIQGMMLAQTMFLRSFNDD